MPGLGEEGHFRLRTDGGARGNPGPAGIGVVLEDPSGQVVAELSEGIGWATNNVAEYQGLIAGLKLALSQDVSRLDVFMDSLLVIEQMKGKYRVKHPGLKPLHASARELAVKFDRVRFNSVPRAENAHADRLMNDGVDRWLMDNPDVPPPNKAQSGLF